MLFLGQTKQQTSQAISIMEAEYVASCDAATVGVWIKILVNVLDIVSNAEVPLPLWMDAWMDVKFAMNLANECWDM